MIAIGSGVLYLISATKRVRNLYLDNGVQVAKHAFSSKIKTISTYALQFVSLAAIGLMISDNY